MQKIYVVEDDENISELVCYALNNGGFKAVSFENGVDFYTGLEKEIPHLIILDIMLPNEDGLTILKKLRQSIKWRNLPIIMLTAKSSEIDKVKGLDSGADDYITKPFSVMELISRINDLLRRTLRTDKNNLSYGSIVIDDEKHTVFVNGEAVNLTLKEYDLLYYLINNAEIVLSRDKIIEAVWGYNYEGESRTIDMHIKTLRQKLGVSGEHIKTIRGVGYKIGE